jgi:hypothetical protein
MKKNLNKERKDDFRHEISMSIGNEYSCDLKKEELTSTA